MRASPPRSPSPQRPHRRGWSSNSGGSIGARAREHPVSGGCPRSAAVRATRLGVLFIGGIANFRWGTPRLTNELDLTLLTGFGNETEYAAALVAEFDSRIVELVRGATLRTYSAEDLIVHKAFAARPQDWVDIEGVILKPRGQLPWGQIWSDLNVLAELKEAPELLETLNEIATRVESVVGPFPHARS